MGKVIESEFCSIRITKVQFVNGLLASVSPNVTANDISTIKNSNDSTFIEVILNTTVNGIKSTARAFLVTVVDLATLLTSIEGGQINSNDISGAEIDPLDTTKVLVILNRKNVAVYEG